jgi:hypothetical protein
MENGRNFSISLQISLYISKFSLFLRRKILLLYHDYCKRFFSAVKFRIRDSG